MAFLLCGLEAVAQGLTEEGRQQILALQEEKATRTADQKKVDSQLLYAAKEMRGEAIAGGRTTVAADIEYQDDARVLVDIVADITPELAGAIAGLGGTVINSFPQFGTLRAKIWVERVEEYAALPGVRAVRRAVLATTNAVTSQGDVTHRAAMARGNFFTTGAGVKVGVLSDSVDHLGASYVNGELSNVTVLPGQAGSGTGEGSAMLEIIRDLAPGAQLYFATAFNGPASFAQNILDLKAAGCSIIVDDVGYFDESPFQDGIIAQAVNSVTAGGALYFSSASNSGNKNDNTSGTWEGDFVDGGPASSLVNGRGGNLHSFGTQTYNTCSGGSSRHVGLFWADPLGASTNDYDVYVLDSAGSTVLRSSTNTQNGTQDPYEFVSTLNEGERIVIVKASGNPRYLHLETGRGMLSISTNGNTRGHSAAADAFSVAAVKAGTSYPNPFSGGAANPVETFSSDGPRRMFFDAAGAAYTPGNFLSTGGIVRQKPDLASADGVDTTVPGFIPFFGTSAAAPHAAAIAALLKSYNPALTPAQIRTALLAGCLDIEAAGVDRDSGAGLLMANLALAAAPAPAVAPHVVAGGLTLISEGTAPANSQIDAAETVTVALTLQNSGSAATSNLTATLLAEAGVSSPSVPQTYGVLAPGGGSAARNFSFRANGPVGGTSKARLQLMDGAANLGVVEFTFNIAPGSGATTAYAGGAGVTIPGEGIGTPYPSTIAVSGSAGTIAKVVVTISGFSHTYPGDVGALLVGPGGQKVVLFNGAGGGTDANAANLVFDDAASSSLPNSIFSGTYRPGSSSTRTFSSPAPASPYSSSLSAFNGSPANGTWRLYLQDFASDDQGAITGWSLSITTQTSGAAADGLSDLAVSLSAPSKMLLGTNSLVATVRNNGPATASGVTARCVLPSGVNYVSSSASQGSTSQSAGTVTASLGTLASGATATFTLNVAPTVGGAFVSHTVTVNGSEFDFNQTNNSAVTGAITGSVDLAPYQPPGWTNKLVISKTPLVEPYTDSSTYTTADNLYMAFAVINNGTFATLGGFSVAMYVDGTLYTTCPTTSSLEPGYYTYWANIALWPLAAGNHTVRIVVDSGNAVAESSESNNEYTRTFTVTGPNRANLVPYTPSGWSAPIVVSTGTGYNYDSYAFLTSDTIYLDSAVLNAGPGNGSATTSQKLYVDNVLRFTWTSSPLALYYYSSITDYSIGSLGLGQHTIKLVADSTNSETETVESDNEYTKTITVAGLPGVTTQAATNVTTTGVQFNGLVTPNGLGTTGTFQYGPTTAYGSSTTVSVSPSSSFSPLAVTKAVAGLTPNSLYHYRLIATNSQGTVNGSDSMFATGPLNAVFSVAGTAAITSNGLTATGITLGTVTLAFSPSHTEAITLVNNTSASPVVGTFTGLPDGSTLTSGYGGNTFYFRLSYTGGDGNDVTLTRIAGPGQTWLPGSRPIVTLTGAPGMGATGGTLTGTVNPNGFITSAQFEYGLSTSYGFTAAALLSPNNATTAQNVSAVLTGLTAGTTYYYRLTATNVDGTASTSGGSFTTLSTNANLAGLALSDGLLSPVFSGVTPSYAATVGVGTGSLKVTPTTAQANATVAVNGTAVTSGVASGAISLGFGTTTITVVVTAQDGVTKKTYTVVVTRGSSLAATWSTAAAVPVTAGDFAAAGVTLGPLTLGFTPSVGQLLTLVNNTGSGAIAGTFSNAAAGGIVTATNGGATHAFRISYMGGTGNDIVLTALGAVPLAQTITFAEIASKRTTDGPFTLAASADSGLPVSYQVVGGSGAATVSGNTVTLTGVPGSVTIIATQAGDWLFAAGRATRTFVVGNTPAFTKIARGSAAEHIMGIRADGTLWAWGHNASGQLGDGTTTQRAAPAQVGTVTSWQSAAVGQDHTVAIRTDGTLWAWGANGSGQLGLGNTTQRTSPVQVGTATNWQSVAAGMNHTVAVKSDGTLWTWGYNASGQLGLGDTSDRNSPVQVGAATNWQFVTAGQNHTMAVRSDGTLWACGWNNFGQLGLGDTTQRTSLVQVGTATNWQSVAGGSLHTVGQRSNGTLWAWGSNSSGQLALGDTTSRNSPVQVGTATNWQSFGAGGYHTVAVKSDGTFWTCGSNANGQLGLGDLTNRTSLVQVGTATNWQSAVAGGTHSVALKSDGMVWEWGKGDRGQLASISRPVSLDAALGNQTVTSAAAGESHSVAVKSNGTLWAWGNNSFGQLGDGSTAGRPSPVQVGTASNWQSVAAGSIHNVAVKSDGTLWVWGFNNNGQLGLGDTTQRTSPVQVGTATNWRSVAAGNAYTVAVKTDGTLWTWGDNFFGQLGLGNTTQRTSPVQVGTATNWQSVAAGQSHTVAVKSDGTLWTWGYNGYGQLGDGTTTDRSTPALVGTATNWQSVTAGLYHTVATKSDGTLWAWGHNVFGQLGDGSTTQRSAPVQVGTAITWQVVATGSYHTVAVKSDGTLWAWGQNTGGQLADGTDTNRSSPAQVGTARGWTLVTAGSSANHTLASRNGRLWAFGSNSGAQVPGGDFGRIVPRLSMPAREAQTVTIPSFIASVGTPVTLAATSNSGLPISYAVSGPATLTGNVLTVTGSGQVILDAWQVGDDVWQYSDVSSAVVTSDIQLEQPVGTLLTDGTSTVGFGNVGLGRSSAAKIFTITNSGGGMNLSGLVVNKDGTNSGDFVVDTTGMASTLVPGASTTFNVTFTPGGSGARSAALHISSNVSGAKNPFDIALTGSGAVTIAQTIAWTEIANKSTTDGPFTLAATASSGLPISYQVASSGGVATVSGNTVTLTGVAGSVTIMATQPGDGLNSAVTVTRTFVVRNTPAFVKMARGSTANNHTIGIRADGTLWAWGSNNNGQLGDGTSIQRSSPVQVGTANNWQSVAAGQYHTVAVKTDGTLWAWGGNGYGQLGLGDTTQRTSPVQVGTGTNWQSVTAGAWYTVAVKNDGTLWAWGFNGSGQLGDGSTTQRSSPVQVGTASNWQSVAASYEHTVAVKTDGTLWAWGHNSNGQLGFGDLTDRTSPVRVGTATNWQSVTTGAAHSVAVKSDGTLWAWGFNGFGQLGLGDTARRTSPVQVGTATTWQSCAAGAYHTLAVKSDGTLWAWGHNSNGQLGLGDMTVRTSPVQVGTATTWQSVVGGESHTVALKSDGTVWEWGKGDSGQLASISRPVSLDAALGNQTVISAAAGFDHSVAVKSDGTLWAWGNNGSGQLGDGSVTTRTSPVQVGTAANWQSVTAGGGHTVAVKSDGTLWAWGNNEAGQLGDGSATARPSPVQVGTATNWQSVTAGSGHTVAVKSDGTLWAWGNNGSGQLGDGGITLRRSPVQVGTESNWQSVAAGQQHTMALKSDGTLWAWGNNGWGQLGLGDSTQRTSPVQVGTATNWQSVTASNLQSLALKSDGTLWASGYNTYGQLGLGDTTHRSSLVQVGTATNWQSVAAGLYHTVAVKSDGTLWAWGNNEAGQLGDGTSTTGSSSPVQVTPGPGWTLVKSGPSANHTLASRNGRLWAFGSNSSGQVPGGDFGRIVPRLSVPARSPQTVTIPSFTATVGTPVTLAGTSSSGLPISYAVSGPATLAGNVLTITGTSQVILDAWQLGDDSGWQTSTWTSVVVSLDVQVDQPAGTPLADGAGTIGFGTIGVGNSSAAKTFQITNTGSNMTLSGLTVNKDGANAGDFVVDTTGMASTLVPGASTTFTVIFTPTGSDARSAALHIASNVTGAKNPYDIALTGSGLSTLAAGYTNGNEVPVTTSSLTATGQTVNFTLAKAPKPGTNLTVVRNTGLEFISGEFSGMANGSTVNLDYNGTTYPFIAWYYGGDGNDLMLLWPYTGLAAWGGNSNSQLGDGSATQRNEPVGVNQIGALAGKTLVQVVRGGNHTLALTTEGKVYAWGLGTSGQLGDNTAISRNTPVAVNTASGTSALSGKTVVGIAAGATHSLALCSDGTVAAWGLGTSGQLGDNTAVSKNAPVAANTANGTSALFGKSVVGIAAGATHSLALCSDGTVAAWGLGTSGQLGDNTAVSKNAPVAVNTASGTSTLFGKAVVRIAAGTSHSLALCSDGTVVGWGLGTSGQLGDNTTASKNAPAAVNTANGTSALFGKTVEEIAAGGTHSLALCSDGTVAAWGLNSSGQLGDNSTTQRTAPAAVNTASGTSALFGKTVVRIAAGATHSLALCSDGTVTAWGLNSNGQLGNNSTTQRTSPTAVNTANGTSALYGPAVSGLSLSSQATHSLAIFGVDLPVLVTNVATNITTNGATLNAMIYCGGGKSTASFEYGTTSSYGSIANIVLSPDNGSAVQNVSAAITGLQPGTTYHFRATISNFTGAIVGSDLTFATNSAPALSLPDSVVIAEATGASGAAVTFVVSANDAEDGALTPSVTTASGSVFAIGDTTVNVSVTESQGITTTGGFVVRVRDTTAPVVGAHANVMVAAENASGATVSFAPGNATDAVGVTSLTYSQESGTNFPIGTTIVTISAKDAANNTGSETFTVTVTNNAPVLTLLGATTLTFEAAATYTDPGVASADLEDGLLTPAIISDTVAPNVPGTYTVTWMATDSGSLAGSATRVVNVVDTTPPVVAAGGIVAAEATSTAGAVVNYEPTSVTDVVGVTSIAYSQASGTMFPIGTTEVTVTATDAANNASKGTFTVTVQDTTEPTVTPPANITVAATSSAGATVSFGAASVNDAVGVTSITYSQASGTMFPIGTTTVTITAKDASNNTGTGSFTVRVTPLSRAQSWREQYFGTISNTDNAADTADPNNNGINNLLEYGLGGDPVGGTTGQGILPQVRRSPENMLQISFTRYVDRSDLTLTVQAADSVAGPWTDLARSTAGGAFAVLALGATAPEAGTGNARGVTVTDLYPATDPAHPRRFMRLKITNGSPGAP